MANKYSDIDLATARLNIVDKISRFIALTKKGANYSGLCPFHDEQTPSFTVNEAKGFYHCFGCGAHGTSIDFVMNYEGRSFPDAVERLIGTLPDQISTKETKSTKPYRQKPAVWRALMKAKEPAQDKDFDHYMHGMPEKTWTYYDIDNQLIGYVCRFPITKPDGAIGKETIPLAWCVNSKTSEMAWRWLSFGVPRPLYGLQKIKKDKSIIIFEGEKTVDAGQKLFPNQVALGWPGGGNAVKNADFSILEGRKVTLWPDFDWQKDKKTGAILPEKEQPGVKAMQSVYEAIKDIAGEIRFVKPSQEFPDGWDVADDAPYDGFEAKLYAKDNIVPASEYFNDGTEKEPEQEIVAETSETVEKAEILREPPGPDKLFRILGFDRDKYYFYQYEKQQTYEMKKSDMTNAGFIELAPLPWWVDTFPNKGGFSKDDAIDWIIRSAHEKGIYDPTTARGRGAWIDGKDIVFHFGNQISVNGDLMHVYEYKSKYIYERDRKLITPSETAMRVEESESIYNIATKFRWTRDASAALLAGWVALAPLCGAIKWRPHIWIAGGAGCGKTTIVNDYVHTLLNKIDLFVQGNSTEAGIRQKLGMDSRPVIFDESEQNNEREQSRVQNILSLIRQSSSESAAMTLKGTISGEAMTFLVRSMFCLSSIQVGMKHQADRERLTVLNLRPKHEQSNANGQWKELEDKLYLLQRDETTAARLFKRSLDLFPTTLINIKTFVTVCSIKFNSVREGDQIGTLMAGAYSMLSDDVVTTQFAKDYVDSFQWDEHRDYSDNDESIAALSTLMECKIRGSYGETSVYEAIKQSVTSATPDEYKLILERHGMKVKDSTLLVSNTSHAIQELMKHTPYAADIKGQFLRIKGAVRWQNERFNGIQSRCVGIPLSCIDL